MRSTPCGNHLNCLLLYRKLLAHYGPRPHFSSLWTSRARRISQENGQLSLLFNASLTHGLSLSTLPQLLDRRPVHFVLVL